MTSGREGARPERILRRAPLGLKRAWRRTRLGLEDPPSSPEPSPPQPPAEEVDRGTPPSSSKADG